MCHTGAYTSKEIGRVFGVGYTAITGSVKRAEQFLMEDKRLQIVITKVVNEI